MTWDTADSPTRVSLCYSADDAHCDDPVFYKEGERG